MLLVNCNSKNMDILASEGVQFLVSSSAAKVPLSSIEGKKIYLLFSANWWKPCKSFIPQVSQLYDTIKESGQNSEIIFVSFDRDEDGFNQHFKKMFWLAVPFNLDLHKRLIHVFNVQKIPSFIPISCNTIEAEDLADEDCVGLIEDYGSEAFPFTKKRRDELKAIDEAKLQGGSLEQLFRIGGQNGLTSRRGEKILVSKLVGKTIGLYFGANWCPPFRTFTKQLTKVYKELRTNLDERFEIILVSTDRDHKEFYLSLSSMPWLAISFEDKTQQDLCRIFNVQGIPTLILIGENGKTITKNGKELISLYGAKGFPFTESRILEIQSALTKEGERLPSQVEDSKHEHVLKLEMAKVYVCDSCNKQGRFWAFSCHVCDYDLHPTCIDKQTSLNCLEL